MRDEANNRATTGLHGDVTGSYAEGKVLTSEGSGRGAGSDLHQSDGDRFKFHGVEQGFGINNDQVVAEALKEADLLSWNIFEREDTRENLGKDGRRGG